MSIEAITWAFKQDVQRSSAKFVLVAMADCADVHGYCWPSVAHLCDATAQNRKTVLVSLERLRADGLVEVTGKRSGRTGSVPIYRLIMRARTAASSPENGTADESSSDTENGTAWGESSPENGTAKQSQKWDTFDAEAVPKTDLLDAEAVPFLRGSSPVFGRKQSQKRDTEPSRTVIEPMHPSRATREHERMHRREDDDDFEVEANSADPATRQAGELCRVMRLYSVDAHPGLPCVKQLVKLGTPVDTIEAACRDTRTKKPDERINAAYIAAKIAGWARDAERDGKPGQAPSGGRARASPRPEKFNATAYVNRNRTRTQPQPEDDRDVIDVPAS